SARQQVWKPALQNTSPNLRPGALSAAGLREINARRARDCAPYQETTGKARGYRVCRLPFALWYPSMWSERVDDARCLAGSVLDAFARVLHVFAESVSCATSVHEAHQRDTEQKRI